MQRVFRFGFERSGLALRAAILMAGVAVAWAASPASAQPSPATPWCTNYSLGTGTDFGASPNPALPGQSISFNGSCSTERCDIGFSRCADDTFNWDFGDGTTATGPTPTHTYSASGTYTVTLSASAEYGIDGTGTASHTVTVLP